MPQQIMTPEEMSEVLRLQCPAWGYHPNTPAPEEFILEHGGMPGSRSGGDAPFFESEKHIRASVGGNRAGKTTKLVLESGAACVGFRPWYPVDSPWFTLGLPRPRAGRRRIRVRYVVPNFAVHLPEVVEAFEAWWPKDWWRATQKEEHGTCREITFFNGNVILFLSHRQAAQQASDFEGIEADLNVWDEPPPEKAWIALNRGVVSTGGRVIVGATVLDASQWFNDAVVVPGDQGDEDICVTWHSIWDNTAENGGCPDQHARGVRMWLNQVKDPDERMAREHGQPMHLGGLVLSAWKDELGENGNLVEPFPIPQDAHIVSCIDPAGSRPFAALHIAYVAEDDDWTGYIFDETYELQTRTDLGMFAKIWHSKEDGEHLPKHPRKSFLTLIDPAANEPQKADEYGRTMRQILFEDYKIDTQPADKRNKVGRLLSLNARIRERRYKAFTTCRRFRAERRRWSWASDKPKKTKGPDDLCDCASYIDASDPPAQLVGAVEETHPGIWLPERYRVKNKSQLEADARFKAQWARERILRDDEIPKRHVM